MHQQGLQEISQKKVAVILINWNSFDCTFDCITSLYAMSFKDYDIILVDNGSNDNSGEKLASIFPHVKFLKIKQNVGFTGSNNVALNYSINRKYLYSLLLNNDTIVKADFLEILVDYLDNHPEAGAVQPLIYFNHDRTLIWNAGSYFNKWTGQTYIEGYRKKKARANEKLKEVDWITGCALLTRNKVIKETGLLDESLFMYYEDLDLSFRIKNCGYSLIYHPASIIYHIAGAAYKAKKKGKEGSVNPIVHYCTIRNRIWIIKKYLDFSQKITAYIISCAYFLAVLIYFVFRLRFVKFKTVLNGIVDGISGRMTSKYAIDKDI